MKPIKLEWGGPFALWPESKGSAKSILSCSLAKGPGLYLWTIEFNQSQLVFYVGCSAKSILERHDVHLSLYLSGIYNIYDPDEFLKGNKISSPPLYAYKDNREGFTERRLELTPKLKQHLSDINVFFALCSESDRVLKRIESSLIQDLWNNSDSKISSFLDNRKVSTYRRQDEDDLTIEMVFPKEIMGIKTSFSI